MCYSRFLACLLSSLFWGQCAFAQRDVSVSKTPDGSFIIASPVEIERAFLSNIDTILPTLRDEYWISHPYLPIGTKVTLRHTYTQAPVQARVGKREENLHTIKIYLQNYREDFDGFGRFVHQQYDSLSNLYGHKKAKAILDSALSIIQEKAQQHELIYTLPAPKEEAGKPQENLVSLKHFFLQLKNIAPQEALPYGRKAIALAQKLKQTETEAELWLELGHANIVAARRQGKIQGRYLKSKISQALQKIGKSKAEIDNILRWNNKLEIVRGGGNSPADDFTTYFTTYQTDSLSDKAYQEYLRIRLAQQDTNKIVWAYKELGDFHKIKTSYEEAERYYFEMLRLRNVQQDQEKMIWVYGFLADFYNEQAQHEKAITYYQKIWEERKKSNHIEGMIWALGGMRETCITQGLPEKALAYQRQIFQHYADLVSSPHTYGNPPKEYRYQILSWVISHYLASFPEKAGVLFGYLVEWRQDALDDHEKKILTNTIIAFAREKKQLEIAIDLLKKILPTTKNEKEKITLLNDMGFLHQQNSAYKESLACFEQATDIVKKQQDNSKLVVQYNKIAYLHESQKQWAKARKMYEKGVPLLRNAFDLFLQHCKVGKTYEAEKKLKQASEVYLKALKSLDNMNVKNFRREENERYEITEATTNTLIDISKFYETTYPNKEKAELIRNRYWNLVFGN